MPIKPVDSNTMSCHPPRSWVSSSSDKTSSPYITITNLRPTAHLDRLETPRDKSTFSTSIHNHWTDASHCPFSFQGYNLSTRPDPFVTSPGREHKFQLTKRPNLRDVHIPLEAPEGLWKLVQSGYSPPIRSDRPRFSVPVS